MAPALRPCVRPACLPLQSNHRSWADFFIDPYITQGRAAMMSRWAAWPAAAVPQATLGACMGGGSAGGSRSRL